jgi:D-alanyl-D-alanine carboxypeptidase/D-alanyl-D-alanine-endopeptidase (penicillin-binding protein 4)
MKIILFLSFTLLTILFDQPYVAQVSVNTAVNQFVQDPVNKNAKISFKAIDLATGEKIADFHPDSPLVAASTMKLFSTSSALEILGGDYQISTRIYMDGFIDKDSVLHGNIWIRGGGDIGLGSKYFNQENKELAFLQDWTDSLKSKGIKFIEGALIADGSEFGYEGTPATWSDGDVGNYYGAFAGGLNFYDNTVKLQFKTGAAGSKPVFLGVYPEMKGYQLENKALSANVRTDQTSIYGDAFEYNRKITGSIPCNRSYYVVKGSMPDPEFQLCQEWLNVLLKNNIQVEDGAKGYRLNQKELHANGYDNKFLLFEVKSKTVQEIAYWTNLKSVNLFADGLLHVIAHHEKGDGSTKAGLEILTDYWKSKIDMKGMVINDGCGLSRSNAISANHFCQLLSYMYSSKKFEQFKSTLPVAGKTGTVKFVCVNGAGQGRIYMKSGTLKGVKAFSGYVYSSTGKIIAFSLCANNFSCSSETEVAKMEKILNAMAQY